MSNIQNIQFFAKAVLDNANIEKQAKDNKNQNTASLLYHSAKAYREKDQEAVMHIEANITKDSSYYAIRGQFSKAKTVGLSDKVFTETTSISALYAEILKDRKENSAPKELEKSAKKAIMESLGMDQKAWNSLTHTEQGELIEQGKAIISKEDSNIQVFDAEDIKNILSAFVQVNGEEALQAILDSLNTEAMAEAA